MKIQSSYKYERMFCEFARKHGYHAERVAASGAAQHSVCDVVIIKNGKAFLVEVKSTKEKEFKVPGQQVSILIGTAISCGATPLLAAYFKRRKWIVKALGESFSKINVEENGWHGEQFKTLVPSQENTASKKILVKLSF